jgi:hypothetical protein
MQVNPVSQQNGVDAKTAQPAPKAPSSQKPRQAVAQVDTVVPSEQAKDLAAQQTGKGASEEANESMAAKQLEARIQVAK